jgi:alpha-L-fucosidase
MRVIKEIQIQSGKIYMQKVCFLALMLFFMLSCKTKQKADPNPIVSEKDKRMEWWRESRFGMFIHWGLYTQVAGEWNGERIP